MLGFEPNDFLIRTYLGRSRCKGRSRPCKGNGSNKRSKLHHGCVLLFALEDSFAVACVEKSWQVELFAAFWIGRGLFVYLAPTKELDNELMKVGVPKLSIQ